jgi:hypothetical protein
LSKSVKNLFHYFAMQQESVVIRKGGPCINRCSSIAASLAQHYAHPWRGTELLADRHMLQWSSCSMNMNREYLQQGS